MPFTEPETRHSVTNPVYLCPHNSPGAQCRCSGCAIHRWGEIREVKVCSGTGLVGGSAEQEPRTGRPQNACIVPSHTAGGRPPRRRRSGCVSRGGQPELWPFWVQSLTCGRGRGNSHLTRLPRGFDDNMGCLSPAMGTQLGARVPPFFPSVARPSVPSLRQNIYILIEVPVSTRGTSVGGIRGSVAGQEKPFTLPESQARQPRSGVPGSRALLPHQGWRSSSLKHHFPRIAQILPG